MQNNTISVPGSPAIEGLTFRHLRGVEDAEVMYAVHKERMIQDGVDPLSTYEDFPSLEGLKRFLPQVIEDGLQNNYIFAEIAGNCVGYSEMESWSEDDGTRVYLILGWVVPQWRGKGIGTAMLHWCENKARELAANEHPGEKFEFAANASSTEKDTTALLLNEGYSSGYNLLEMGWDNTLHLPHYELPEGIELKPVLAEHYLLIAKSVEEAYKKEYDDGRFQETFDPLEFVEQISAPKHDSGLWQIAWADNQVVGQVLSYIRNNQAEVFEVSVVPAWRRQKLARVLLSKALSCLRSRGIEVIRLHTVAEFKTRASDLYRSVGFKVLKEFPRYRKSI